MSSLLLNTTSPVLFFYYPNTTIKSSNIKDPNTDQIQSFRSHSLVSLDGSNTIIGVVNVNSVVSSTMNGMYTSQRLHSFSFNSTNSSIFSTLNLTSTINTTNIDGTSPIGTNYLWSVSQANGVFSALNSGAGGASGCIAGCKTDKVTYVCIALPNNAVHTLPVFVVPSNAR